MPGSKTLARIGNDSSPRAPHDDDDLKHAALATSSSLAELDQQFQRSTSKFLDTPRRKVFRLGDVVIKFGLDVDVHEARTLRFIADSTSIPVPRVHDARIYDNGTTVIEMGYIEGTVIAEAWMELSQEQKKEVANQLRCLLLSLGEHKGSYIGGVEGGPAVDCRRLRVQGGPFGSEREFNAFLCSDIVSVAPSIFRTMIEQSMGTEHEIVLTHGDLNPRNILVKDGKIVALLDWETAGWYPEYWEFVKFFNTLNTDLDWYTYADQIFPQIFAREFINDSFLGRISRH